MNANPPPLHPSGSPPTSKGFRGRPPFSPLLFARLNRLGPPLPRSKRSTSIAFRSTLVAPARRSLLR
jgi:hypothetical protein